jgi:hypothetical protein
MLSRIGLFASLPLLVLAGTASAGNARLDALFNNQATGPVSNICYARHYDKAHLASHPKQNVTEMLVYFVKRKGDEGNVYYQFDGQVKFRDSRKAFTFDGDCNRDKPGEPVHCGIDCDGGGFNADAKDGKSIELKIGDSGIRLGDAEDDAPLGSKGFQSDDETFLLQQTDLRDCLPVIYDDDVKAAVKKGTVTQ